MIGGGATMTRARAREEEGQYRTGEGEVRGRGGWSKYIPPHQTLVQKKWGRNIIKKNSTLYIYNAGAGL